MPSLQKPRSGKTSQSSRESLGRVMLEHTLSRPSPTSKRNDKQQDRGDCENMYTQQDYVVRPCRDYVEVEKRSRVSFVTLRRYLHVGPQTVVFTRASSESSLLVAEKDLTRL